MSVTQNQGEERLDLTSATALHDPSSAFASVRRERPVFRDETLGGWILTRRADVEQALVDHRTFACGGTGAVPVPDEFADEVDPAFFGDTWIAMDPPRNLAPRKAGQRGFSRRAMIQLEPVIDRIARELIDGFAARGACELMQEYCLALTTRTLLALLDLPPSEEAMLDQLRSDHLEVFTSLVRPIPEPERHKVWSRYVGALRSLTLIAEARRDGSGSDVISAMSGARDSDGEPVMSARQVALHVIELAFAGTDTTANLIGNAAVLLDGTPEVVREAVMDPSRWAAVVEETLRRHSSATAVPRYTTRDVVIGGVTIPAGEMVWLALSSANNDEAHYDAPERFDVHRARPEDHLAFGKGRHFCLGAPLARLEGEIGLRALYGRLPDLRVDAAASEFVTLPINSQRRRLPAHFAPQVNSDG